MKNENVLYVIENQHGTVKGSIHYIDLNTGELVNEMTNEAVPYLPEYSYRYNSISKAQYDEILGFQKKAAETNKSYVKNYLRALTADVLKSAQLNFIPEEKEPENCIYVIENEKGDEGFIYRIDLDNNKVIDEVSGCVTIYNSDYGYCYEPISEKMYQSIFNAHREWEKTESAEDFNTMQDLIASVLDTAKALKIK